MTTMVRALLEKQIDLLFQGRCSEMLAHFDLPLAVQINAEMTVLSSPEQFIDTMTGHRANLIASGVTGLSIRLAAIELSRRGRFRAWADIDHHRAGMIDQSADQIIIYCREEEGEIRIELLHCSRFALSIRSNMPRSQLA